ncbi:hypothetical protein KX935_02455 [Streptobacillus moniliformis]|nr:hypothetical protein KX935_02455 [Streptobacillus moniliformis]
MLKKYGSYGLAQVYVSCKNKGYNRSFGSMCRINYPSEKVQVDIKYIPNECIKFNSKGIRYYKITAIDEYSRKRVLKVVKEKSTYETSKYIKELERAIGFKIETIQVDNGYEFVNDKDVTDREDGKILYSRKEFRSEEELIENVKRHERLYNNRAKTVLNFKSPNEVVRE